jgi:ribonuclease HII
MHEDYPEYGFDGHSGYVNVKHTNMIIEHGYCPYHRQSYNIKKLAGHDIKQNIRT